MSALTQLLARLRLVLEDGSTARYSADLLEQAVRLALDELSVSLPQVVSLVATFTESSNQQPLPQAVGLRVLIEVYYPWTGNAGPAQGMIGCGWQDGVARLCFARGLVAQAGEQARIVYVALHTLQGLDEATQTSLSPDLMELLVKGASAQAALLRWGVLSELYGARNEAAASLEQWGALGLADFRAQVQQRSHDLPAGLPLLPQTGWEDCPTAPGYGLKG